MLRHVVIGTVNDAADADRFETALRSCRHLVPGIREFDVGARSDGLEADGDVVLVATFDDEAAFSAYLEHPHHRTVAIGLGTMRQSRAVFDFASRPDHPSTPVEATGDDTAAGSSPASASTVPRRDAPPAPSPGDYE